MNWVRSWQDGLDYIEHLDGVDWYDAPRPRRWHRCVAQTRGRMGGGRIERCACGAARLDAYGPWVERNQRGSGARDLEKLRRMVDKELAKLFARRAA